MQCKANTKSGRNCHNSALDGREYCHVHSDHEDAIDLGKGAAMLAGAVFGNAIVPGLGGIVAGGLFGGVVKDQLGDGRVRKKKVFVSFDYDNDKGLKELMIGQSRLPDSPFEIADHSLKEAAPEHNWERKARRAIKRADLVIVMVGHKTHRAQGVLKEIGMARNAGKRIVQMIGYREGNYTAVPAAGRLYAWNWGNLKKLLG